MGRYRTRRRQILRRLAFVAVTLFPLGLGLGKLATSWVEAGILRRLGGTALRSLPPGVPFEPGRVIALLGRVDPEAPVVNSAEIVLGVTERLRVRQVSTDVDYPGRALRRARSYEEYDVERISTPPFPLVLENGQTVIVNGDYAIDHAPELDYSDGDLVRYRGFKPGDWILAVGTMTDQGFAARAVSDKSLPDYRQRLQERIQAARSWGWGWSVLGSCLLAYAFVRCFGGRSGWGMRVKGLLGENSRLRGGS